MLYYEFDELVIIRLWRKLERQWHIENLSNSKWASGLSDMIRSVLIQFLSVKYAVKEACVNMTTVSFSAGRTSEVSLQQVRWESFETSSVHHPLITDALLFSRGYWPVT